ncbi:zinc finger protein 26 [Folsomia candida]|uniref:zinc finger protein 26 n=1 Tax=Folsomia candida TaxID=158441 RepID=UPI000B8EEDE1|nr:zinc finger protein 26 [Folsomia candida]
MGSTCFFCRLNYPSIGTENNIPLFLTCLSAVNVNSVEIEVLLHLGKEDFHACPQCVAILEKISSHLFQLGQELNNIYTILQNCDAKGASELDKLRRQIIQNFDPNVHLNLFQPVPTPNNDDPTNVEDFADPIKSEINPEGYPEQDQIDLELVKVEADGETEVELGDFILFPDDVEPDYVPDTDPLDSLSSPEDCPVDDPLADPPPARKRRMSSPPEPKCKVAKTATPVITEDHIAKLVERLPFQCHIENCCQLFETKELLEKHTNLRHTVHACVTCNIFFPLVSQLDRHIVTVHPEQPNPLKCPTCAKAFTKRHNFNNHVKRCHVVVEEPDASKFPRIGCVQTSDTTWTYLDVAISLVGDKYVCSRCDCTRPTKALLMTHIRSRHTTHLPFACGFIGCGWPFANQLLLDDHLAKSGHGREACKFCGKLFFKRYMGEHVLSVHEGSNRFICQTCGKGFHTQYACTKHESSTCPTRSGTKSTKLTAEEKSRLRAARESILGQEIVSNPCKHCAKIIFGSLASLSCHQDKCRHGVVAKEEEKLGRGIYLIGGVVEIATVVVLTDPQVLRLKCSACNKTFVHRPEAVAHVQAHHCGQSS